MEDRDLMMRLRTVLVLQSVLKIGSKPPLDTRRNGIGGISRMWYPYGTPMQSSPEGCGWIEFHRSQNQESFGREPLSSKSYAVSRRTVTEAEYSPIPWSSRD